MSAHAPYLAEGSEEDYTFPDTSVTVDHPIQRISETSSETSMI